MTRTGIGLLVFGAVAGCGPHGSAALSDSSTPDSGNGNGNGNGDGGVAPPAGAIPIPAEPQRTNGDPQLGYTELVNDIYIRVGIPWSGFSYAMSTLDPSDALPGRNGASASVGYTFNVGTNSDGMEVAASNCLQCHATHLNGALVVGLGRPDHSLALPSGIAIDPPLITLGLTSADELSEFDDYGSRLLISQDAGAGVAFGALAAHHSSSTLAWSDSAGFDATTGLQGWVDVPPWWRTAKLNALYANGMGRGDQVHHMMNMTIFSVDTVAQATAIDAMFVNIAAYLRSIQPPKYPRSTDATLVARGEQVFADNCAECHGTYGDSPSFPNLLIPVEMVGTDPALAVQSWINPAAATWFAASFFGQGARFDVEPGYVAPPLDGIWATAPFFHNGSVPTLEGVLDSSVRPASWNSGFGDAEFDYDAVGWSSTGNGSTYDTTAAGDSNAGHTYGDGLSSDDRHALIEYLKTL